MSTQIILIIDGQNNLYRAHHSYHGLKSTSNEHTSCIFGFPSIIKPLLQKFKPHKTIICWDGKRSKERLEILPTYKAKRSESITGNEVREAIQEQRPTVMKLIYALGICQAYSKQVEGDDMLYMVWRRYKRLIKSGKSYKLIIVSRDKDFHQLIDKDTSVWDPFKGMLLTKNNLKALFNYEPHEVVDYLCLLGDSSDNIPGYRGFGEKRVREFIDNYKLVNGQYRIKKPMRVDLIKLADTLAVNRKLIDLAMFHRKHQPNKTIEYFNSKRNPKLDVGAVKNIARKYSIGTFFKSDFLKTFE